MPGRRRVAGLTLDASPPLGAEAAEAEGRAEAEERAEAEPMPAQRAKPAPADDFDVPDLPVRPPAKQKVWFYVSKPVADELDKFVRYAAFHFGLKQGEVQEIVLSMGLDNRAEILRAMRERAGR
jgi:hypothetical protein